ncbi:thymidylate synthase [Nonomuraea sp. NPDC049400]|uniref:thymidylate synthase n=1 Tax=Nonomuraea sp. NPDC049400 TaxID=3364352 RepID=UPI0037AE64A2
MSLPSPSMSPPTFATFHDAYLAVLRQVLTQPQYTTSSRGNRSSELLNVSFTLSDPRNRTPYLAARKANIVFNYAEALWYLAGRDDLDMIAYYAPGLRDLSSDGVHLTGTAYGPRLFAPPGASQWDRVIELLSRDRDSKRAVMPIMRVGELTDLANPDVACTLALQFVIREDRLHTIAFMRGNDVMLGLLCDVFSFTLIAEYTAVTLGVELGTYTHHASSMHLNDPDVPRATAILAEAAEAVTPAAPPPQPMPSDTTRQTLERVLGWEQQLRLNQRPLDLTVSDAAQLGPYWQQVLVLLETYRQIVHTPHAPIAPATLAALSDPHRWLVACRWPNRLPQTAAATAGASPW